MRGILTGVGMVAALLVGSAGALAAPQVVALGSGDAPADPVAACGEMAASPYEPDWLGRGLDDKQIFLDGAMAACEAAVAASPDSAEAATWLARVYVLVGRAPEAAALLERAGAAGNAYADYLLGRLLDGRTYGGVDSDSRRSDALLQQAADAGFALAERDLAGRYEIGDGVDLDYAEAARLYQSAASHGDGYGFYKLGLFQQAGLGVPVNFDRAMALFRRATDLGDPAGWNGIGQLYDFGQGVAQDHAKAAEAYRHGAEQREPMSETALAYLHEQGLGVAQDYDKSFALLLDAAAQGYSFGKAALALHYLFGQGTPVDARRAFDLAWQAESGGVVYAYGIVGYMLAEGQGTERDLIGALSHFQGGADRGDSYSADRIQVVQAEIECQGAAGSPYEDGGFSRGIAFEAIDAAIAVPACQAALGLNTASAGDATWLARAYLAGNDVASALPFLQLGIDAGNELAQQLYADLLLGGNGVARDVAQALSLYDAAAAQDFAPAQLALARIYAAGELVPADPARARDYLQKAADKGLEAALDELAEPADDDGGLAPAAGLDVGFGEEGPAY